MGVSTGRWTVNSSSKLEVSAAPLTVGKNGGLTRFANTSSQFTPLKNACCFTEAAPVRRLLRSRFNSYIDRMSMQKNWALQQTFQGFTCLHSDIAFFDMLIGYMTSSLRMAPAISWSSSPQNGGWSIVRIEYVGLYMHIYLTMPNSIW